MNLSTLPDPVKTLLRATEAHDTVGVLAAFAPNAVLTDMGKDHRGNQIRKWNEELYIGSKVRVHPLHAGEREGHWVLAVAVDGDYASYGVTEPFQLDWHITVEDGHIATLRMVETKLDLPPPVKRFVQTMNMYDLDGLVATFTADAIVNDQKREHAGRPAIRAWLAREIVGDKVRMYVTGTKAHEAGFLVVAKVTGDYDKANLPDPLTLRFYFSLSERGITQLIVVPATDIDRLGNPE